VPLRGAERATCDACRASRAVAVVESVALEVWHREEEEAFVELARGTAARLDGTRERTADGGGVGGDSALCSARTTLWR
jgi:hypothetical protein